uniref:CUPID domain-containing protein n=1 Tax=Elaeophora elaphi TaxID=1147741 RepID=A0A0R3RL76_9BILA
RKKNSSSLKVTSNLLQELRAEVQHLRKLQSRSPNLCSANVSAEDNLSLTVLPNDRNAIGLSSSRASSIASSTDVCPLATGNSITLISRTTVHQKESQQLQASPSSNEASHVQQQMIEKIIKLQRQLARRQDKIEFLEEHVRQCTQELLKKTKWRIYFIFLFV